MRQFNFSIIFLTLLIFSGCSLSTKANSYKLPYIHSTNVTNFSQLTANLLDGVSPFLIRNNPNKALYVIDFVNINELENHSELGFVLSEELKTLVTQNCHQTIHQIEFTKYLKLGANGSKLLSRDTATIKNQLLDSNTYALVGTYAITQRQLILYLKVINLQNGVILKSSTVSTPLTDEIIWLEQKYKQNTPKKSNKPSFYQQTPLVL